MKHLERFITIALCVLLFLGTVPAEASSVDLMNDSPIRVGVTGKMEPLLFIGEDGRVTGAFADMMAYIADNIDRSIEYVQFRETEEVMAALEKGDVDAVLGVMAANAEGRSSVMLSREIYAANMCIVSAKSLKIDDTSMYGSYQTGTIDRDILEVPSEYSFYSLPNQDAVMDYLIYGRADRVFALWDCVSYRLRRDGLEKTFTVTSGNLAGISYGIAVRKKNVLLQNSINGAITALRNDRAYDTILSNWNIQTEIEAARLRTARLLKIIGAIAAGAALIVMLFTFFNMRLRSLVRAKTAELSEKVDDLEHASSLRNALIEQASAGSMVLKLDGTILLMNDAMRKMLRLTEDDVVPHIEELGFVNRAWERAPAEMDQPELFTERDENGQVHTYRYQNHRTAKHDERVFIIEDITREESEKQAAFEEDKNRALNRIIAGLAHEIKNPLTTLKAYAFLAETPDDDPEFYDSFSKYVPGEINRISKLVENLVNYSKPVRGQKERVCIADISDSCLGLAYVTSKNKITIETDVDRSLFIRANGDQLRQALVNFFLNSIESVEEAKAEGKENCLIRHSVYRREDNVVIEVYDSGMGMDEDQLKSCTDPFFTTKKTGTGMGLAIAKQYIKENDGTLETESEKGEYTIMRMVFAEDKENE